MAATAAAPASELERRKQVKIRLRPDLCIEPQKYEGRTYWVVKDPISLRYYRLKDNERFLLRYMDGKHTLDEAQKEYEKNFKPERLRLEDLESFAQQLLTAGLAQNDSPRAGTQLYERRNKRRRTEWMQTLTNILYIKIPVFDPDRVLTKMLKPLGFIFTLWFFAISVAFMLAAVILVMTHFELFRSKLPDYQEFFSFRTMAYLWMALGVVKVIHEFGHGLSCKKFGGEVHEMGALFLCLSPALYCNVSDAWTLPNKWHRIIISSAGIYVELVIAAIATFVWWNTPTQPFVNHMALCLMVVCSVSTVVFNANPLMRYDGYYVLADWLEIPNLRERSNRYLQNLVLEHCLGVEVMPEPYMEMRRKILFISYAVLSYVYRWVVTFTILYFMYSFLRPYKLEVISNFLAILALGSLVGWPAWRFGKSIYRRGRLPDMKPVRVTMTALALTAFVLFVCLVPVPVSRVRGVGLVMAHPEATSKVFVRYPGLLEKLHVGDGRHVRKGDVLAEFSNRELEEEIGSLQTEADVKGRTIDALARQREQTTDLKERSDVDLRIATARGERDTALGKKTLAENIKRRELVLLAPRDGIVSGAPTPDDIGKFFDKDQQSAATFCTITEPGRLRVCLPVTTSDLNQLRENVNRLSPAARAARARLNRKVTVNYQGMPLKDALTDLMRQAPGLRLKIDPAAGLAPDFLVSYSASGARLLSVLDGMFDRVGLGYVLVSSPGDERDGWVLVRPGRERGIADGSRTSTDLPVTLRVHGRDNQTWAGRIERLPESEAREIPPLLASRNGGPVAVKAGSRPESMIPQAQQYLVFIDIVDPDPAIASGNLAQAKIHCKPETCLRWLWRTINDLFDLGLL